MLKLENGMTFVGMTMLSAEEYSNLKTAIPKIEGPWWLRSRLCKREFNSVTKKDVFIPLSDYLVQYVDEEGSLRNLGSHAVYGKKWIRPVLIIRNLGTVHIGETVNVCGENFKVISFNFAIMERGLMSCRFDNNNNDYEGSEAESIIDAYFARLCQS